MSPMIEQEQPNYRKWLRGSFIFLALVPIVRFVLEVAGVSHTITRFFASTAALFLVAIYLGAVAPRRGVQRFVQLLLPSLLVSAWTVGWVVLFTVISAVLRLERSHFAVKEDYANWGRLGGHVFGHVVGLGVFFVLIVVVMAVPYLLGRWPVTVGPAALLGAIVVIRYWTEAMGVAPTATAALSSTVGVFVCGFYLGGVGADFGLAEPKALLLPAVVIGVVWRFWVFLATLLSALLPFYKTHFFDPSTGRVAQRLAVLLAANAVEGLVVGLVLWGIAVWIRRAIRPLAAVS